MMAYFLDRGIWFFGSKVEIEVDKAGDSAGANVKNARNRAALINGARARTLDRMLGGDGTTAVKFKDPVKSGAVK